MVNSSRPPRAHRLRKASAMTELPELAAPSSQAVSEQETDISPATTQPPDTTRSDHTSPPASPSQKNIATDPTITPPSIPRRPRTPARQRDPIKRAPALLRVNDPLAQIATLPLPVVTPDTGETPALVLFKDVPLSSFQQQNPPNPKASHILFATASNAFEAIGAYRVRSLLTGLSVVIGIAAVIATLVLTQGAGIAINRQIQRLGDNAVLISSYALGTSQSSQSEAITTLTEQDAAALQSVLHVTGISPLIPLANTQVTSDSRTTTTNIQGVGASYLEMQGWQMMDGAWFSGGQDVSGTPVAVLGQTAAYNLFGYDEPVGQSLRIGNQTFKVVGVLAPKGESYGVDQDDTIIIPYRAALFHLRSTTDLDQIVVKIDAAEHMDRAQQAIMLTLQHNHAIQPGFPDDFELHTSSELLAEAQQLSLIFTSLFLGMALVSLTAGGIGIMNIMLASVSERIREIGMCIALGARRRDICYQFLSEALIICLLSSIPGLGLGLLVALALSKALIIPFVLAPATLLTPLIVSTATGLLFGLIPALRAARLDPIEALRIEE